MRERVLYNSTRVLLEEEERIRHLVHMWGRHRLSVPYIVGAFGLFLVLAFVIGIEQWGGRLGLAFAGGAIAAMATTEYRILALTTESLVLLRSSRIRQKATSLLRRLPDDAEVAPVGSNLVITDWSVAGEVYSVMKRQQSAMVAISER